MEKFKKVPRERNVSDSEIWVISINETHMELYSPATKVTTIAPLSPDSKPKGSHPVPDRNLFTSGDTVAGLPVNPIYATWKKKLN